MATGKLTDTAIKRAKHADKPVKLADGGGLYLLVNKTGKYWRMDYRYAGKRKTLALGVYPTVSLKQARERRDEAKTQLDAGTDPATVKRQRKTALVEAAKNTFEALGRDWYAKQLPGWVAGHAKRVLASLENDVYPWIGGTPIADIRVADVLAILKRIQERGAVETAHRTRGYIEQIFAYAAICEVPGLMGSPAAGLSKALKPKPAAKHFPTITEPKRIGDLLRAIDGYSGQFVTRCLLQLHPLLMVRPGELRAALWADIDLEAAEWRFNTSKTKTTESKRLHIVPLPKQAVAILRELHPLTSCRSVYVFPGQVSAKRPASENTARAALRRMGYGNEDMSPHGFRAMASTLLHEMGYPHAHIEKQLAHLFGNEVSRAYNHADHLAERRAMLQAWADYLAGLKKGASVTAIGTQKKAKTTESVPGE